jgi:hypothetical protein
MATRVRLTSEDVGEGMGGKGLRRGCLIVTAIVALGGAAQAEGEWVYAGVSHARISAEPSLIAPPPASNVQDAQSTCKGGSVQDLLRRLQGCSEEEARDSVLQDVDIPSEAKAFSLQDWQIDRLEFLTGIPVASAQDPADRKRLIEVKNAAADVLLRDLNHKRIRLTVDDLANIMDRLAPHQDLDALRFDEFRVYGRQAEYSRVCGEDCDDCIRPLVKVHAKDERHSYYRNSDARYWPTIDSVIEDFSKEYPLLTADTLLIGAENLGVDLGEVRLVDVMKALNYANERFYRNRLRKALNYGFAKDFADETLPVSPERLMQLVAALGLHIYQVPSDSFENGLLRAQIENKDAKSKLLDHQNEMTATFNDLQESRAGDALLQAKPPPRNGLVPDIERWVKGSIKVFRTNPFGAYTAYQNRDNDGGIAFGTYLRNLVDEADNLEELELPLSTATAKLFNSLSSTERAFHSLVNEIQTPIADAVALNRPEPLDINYIGASAAFLKGPHEQTLHVVAKTPEARDALNLFRLNRAQVIFLDEQGGQSELDAGRYRVAFVGPQRTIEEKELRERGVEVLYGGSKANSQVGLHQISRSINRSGPLPAVNRARGVRFVNLEYLFIDPLPSFVEPTWLETVTASENEDQALRNLILLDAVHVSFYPNCTNCNAALETGTFVKRFHGVDEEGKQFWWSEEQLNANGLFSATAKPN